MSPTSPAADAALATDVSLAAPGPEESLLRIQAVAEDVGLTPRSIRYYEEIGLLKPAARSEGAYRPVATYAHSFPSWTSLTKPDQRKLDAIAPACGPAMHSRLETSC